ncbi:MAG: glycosyltransferase family 32 protein [Acutalibacteraceae bacterium]
MIPKVIHYCWFGGKEKPKSVQKCIASWKKNMPDYKIIEWNEDNFDMDIHPYTRFCFDNKKWAFLSDFARLWVVNNNGGLYFDTDVEALKSFDELLVNDAFFGFENKDYIASGLGFGAVAHHITVEAMLKEYDYFCSGKEEPNFIGCPTLNTKALIPLGLKLNGEKQIVENALILPADYLNPFEDSTGRVRKTENTYSIHWYSKSALKKKDILRSKITRPFHRLFGEHCFDLIKKMLK